MSVCDPRKLNEVHPTLIKDAVDGFRSLLFPEITKSGLNIYHFNEMSSKKRNELFENVWNVFSKQIMQEVVDTFDALKEAYPNLSDEEVKNEVYKEDPDLKNNINIIRQKPAFLQEVSNALADFDLKLTLQDASKDAEWVKEYEENNRDGVLTDKFSVDSSDLVDTNVKIALSSFVQKEYKDGQLIPKIGYFGFNKLYDYDFINRTIASLGLNAYNTKDIIDNLDKSFKLPNNNYREGYFWIDDLKKIIKLDNDKSIITPSDARFIAAFETAFRGYNYSPVRFIMGEDPHFSDIVNFYNTKDTIDIWKNSILAKTQLGESSLFKLENNETVIDRTTKEYESFINNKNNSLSNMIEKLNLIGIDLPASILENDKQSIILDNGREETINEVIKESYNRIVEALNNKVEAKRPNTLKELFEDSSAGRIKNLAEVYNVLNPNVKRFMATTAAGKNQYTKQSQSSVVQDAIKIENLQKIEDIYKQLPQLCVPFYFNTSTSFTISNLFHEDGSRKKQSDYKVVIIQGVGVDNSKEGKGEASLFEDEQLILNLNSIFKNIFPLGMNADKTTSYGIQLSRPFVSWTDCLDPVKRTTNYNNLLKDELCAAWKEIRSSVNVETFSNEVFKLGSFNGIFNEKELKSVIGHFFGEYLEYDESKKIKDIKFKRNNVSAGDTSSFLDKIDTYFANTSKLTFLSNVYNRYTDESAQVLFKEMKDYNLLKRRVKTGEYYLKGFDNDIIKTATGLLSNSAIPEEQVLDLCKYLKFNYLVSRLEQDKLYFGHAAFYKDPYKRLAMFMAIKTPMCNDERFLEMMRTPGVTQNGFLPRLDGRTDFISDTNKDMFIHSVAHEDHLFTSASVEMLTEQWYKNLEVTPETKEQIEKELGAIFTEDGKFKEFILDKGEATGLISNFIGNKGADSMSYYMFDQYWKYRRGVGDMSQKEYNQMEYDWAYDILYRHRLSQNKEIFAKREDILTIPLALRIEAGTIMTKYKNISPDAPLGVIKSQYAGHDKFGTPVAHKTAPIYLSARIVEGTAMEELYLDMLESKIDILVPRSGQKVGHLLNSDGKLPYITNLDGTFSLKDKEHRIQLLYPDKLGKQTEITEHNEVKGSQEFKIQYSNSMENETLKQLTHESLQVKNKLIQKQTEKIFKESGLTENSKDPTKLFDRIKTNLRNSGYPEDKLESLNIENHFDLSQPLDANSIKNAIESMLWSIFNDDFINPYHPGMAAMQIHNVGLEPVKWCRINPGNGRYEELTESQIKTSGLTQKDLHIVSGEHEMYQVGEDGNTKPIEVHMGWMFKESPEELGLDRNKHCKSNIWTIPEGFIDPKLLRYVMNRIPTGGMNSMHSVVSLKMFDPSRGHVVGIGSCLVFIGGSDFDGDKMMVFRRNYIYHKDGAFILDKEGNVVGTTKYKIIAVNPEEDSLEGYQNKLMDLREQLLLHPANFNSLSTPITVGDAKSIADKIDKLLGLNESSISNSTLKTHELENTIKARILFLQAKTWLGPGARAVCQHILNQVCKFELSGTYDASRYRWVPTFTKTKAIVNPFTTEDVPILGKLNNNEGKLISTTLTNLLQAILETAKDLVATRLGMTDDNKGAVFNYLMQGANLEQVAMLCRQPIIQDWTREKRLGNSLHYKVNRSKIKDAGKQLKDETFGSAKKDIDIFKEILKKYGYKTDEKSIKSYAEQADAKRKISTKELEDGLKNKDNQIIFLIKYFEMELQGSPDFTANQAFNTDTVNTKTFIESIMHQNLYNKVEKDNYIANPEDINKMFIGKLNDSIKELQTKFQKYFLYLNPAYKSLIDSMLRDVANPKKLIRKDKQVKTINNFINFIFNYHSQLSTDISGNQLSTQAKSLMFGDNSLPMILQKIKEGPKKYNNLWANLIPIISSEGYANGLRLLKINNTPYEVELLLKEMKLEGETSKIPEIRQFVDAIAKFDLLQAGMNSSKNRISKILPNDFTANLLDETFKNLKDKIKKGDLDSYINEENTSKFKTIAAEIWENFLRNNSHNDTVVKPVTPIDYDINEETGNTSKGTGEGDFIYVKGRTSGIIKIPLSKNASDYEMVVHKIKNKKTKQFDKIMYSAFCGDDNYTYYRRINAWGLKDFHVEINPVDNKSIHPQNLPFDENNEITHKLMEEIINSIGTIEEKDVSLQDMKTTEDIKTYSGNIEKLEPNQIFVFGSNPVGINGNPEKGTGGAALVATNKEWVKQSEKMDNRLSDSGKAWGLTTVSYPGKKLSKTKSEIIEGIKKLYDFASNNQDKEFMIAYNGEDPNKVSLNGYSAKDMAQMFSSQTIPSNIIFEKNFANLLTQSVKQGDLFNQQSEIQSETLTKMSDFTNHSGGAYGADTEGDLIGREFGVTDHRHYREESNANLSKRLRDKGVQAVKLTPAELEEGYKGLEQTFNKQFPRTLENNLKARNYFQVKNAEAVYAVGFFNIPELDVSKPDNLIDSTKSVKSYKFTSVKGGTNAAIQMSIGMNKPTYVFDLTSKTWNKWDGQKFSQTNVPTLTKNYALIGTRDIENYNVQKDGKWVPREQYVGKELEQVAQNAIRNLYQNTLDNLKQQPSSTEGLSKTSNTTTDYKSLFSTQELNNMYREHVQLKGENKMSQEKYRNEVNNLLSCPWNITKEELTEAIKCL